MLKSIQTLLDYDVDLVCVEDSIDSSTRGGRLTLAILSAVAEIVRLIYDSGRIIKQISFKFPVYYNGCEGDTIWLHKENTVETVCCLHRVNS